MFDFESRLFFSGRNRLAGFHIFIFVRRPHHAGAFAFTHAVMALARGAMHAACCGSAKDVSPEPIDKKGTQHNPGPADRPAGAGFFMQVGARFITQGFFFDDFFAFFGAEGHVVLQIGNTESLRFRAIYARPLSQGSGKNNNFLPSRLVFLVYVFFFDIGKIEPRGQILSADALPELTVKFFTRYEFAPAVIKFA